MAPEAFTLPRYLKAAGQGILSSLFAEEMESATALYSNCGKRSYRELDSQANRLTHAFRAAGLRPGDPVALVCGNRPEFVEVYLAVLRSGLRLTPINWRLNPAEVVYILEDCEAVALIAEVQFASPIAAALNNDRMRLKLSIGAECADFASYDKVLHEHSPLLPPATPPGYLMLYTSGTTGQPKGVIRETVDVPLPQWQDAVVTYDPNHDVSLCCGPAYHAAPLVIDIIRSLCSRVPLVLMEHFDAKQLLANIERYRVTHMHLVPTMFVRLLALPAEARQKYDLSSLKMVIHGGAPCPVPVKRAMIDWLGPILAEYYAGTEGDGGIFIFSDEWLEKPGSVGRCPEGGVLIVDESGNRLDQGQVGKIYLKISDEARISYHNAPGKTAELYLDGNDNFISLGDQGYMDEEGYLYLSGRTAELIISGGVNVYPQEVDNVILLHPEVADSCTIGVPHPEWGEEVKTVVQLRQSGQAGEELAADIIRFARSRLAHFKCPRSIEFVTDLPRTASGKVQRSRVRDRYRISAFSEQ